MRIKNPTAIALAGTLLFLGGTSCSRRDSAKKPNTAPTAAPNILLITFDTTRADHLEPYGYSHGFTPTIESLAKNSVTFKRAFSSAPLTLPSHTTIMTGLFPFYHGVRDNSHFILNPAAHTLAEDLKEHGYQTAAFVSAFVLDSRFGLDQGFDTYNDRLPPRSEFNPFEVLQRNATAVTDSAIDWFKKSKKDRPYFLWVHYYDPHMPYNAPDSFTRFMGNPYDVEIAYADSELGRLLKELGKPPGNARPTLIAFAGDHGEALGQYGEPTHAYFVYDSTLHVPLMIHWPDGAYAGKKVDVPVSLADIMPTVLDIAGLPVPGPGDIHGRSLVPLLESKTPPTDLTDRPIAFECLEPYYSHGWAAAQGIRVGETKFIDQPIPELYILSKNPRETPATNRFDDMPDLASRMKSRYHELFNGRLSFPPFTQAPQTPPPDVIEKLRALGYVGEDVTQADVSTGGKDLKVMLPLYLRLSEAMALISTGRFTEAANNLVELSQQEPDNRRVLWLLAELAANMPPLADLALPVLEQALQQHHVPASMVPQILVNCGRIYLGKNDNQKALKRFSEAKKLQQDFPGTYAWIGSTYLRLGQFPEALQAFRRASELYGPNLSQPRVALGWALLLNRQPDKAVPIWSKLLDADRSQSPIWNLVGQCPFDPATVVRLTPILQSYATDRALPDRIRGALAILCSKYLAAQGKPAQALAVLAKASPPMSSDDNTFLVFRAQLEKSVGHIEKAKVDLERAHHAAPDRFDATAALAAILEQTGQIDQAVELLSAYHKAHPDTSAATNNLAWMLARQGKDLDLALKLVTRVAHRLPGDANANDTLGWIYHLRGDRQMAIRHLAHAVTIAPTNATYQYHVGVAYREAGRLDDAREAFAKAVELAPMPRPKWFEEAKAAAAQPQDKPAPD